MRLILDANDLKSLINESYNGVKDIKIENNIEIILEVDTKIFGIKKLSTSELKKQYPIIPIYPEKNSEENLELNLEQKNLVEHQQGLMATGGQARVISRI